MEVQSHRLDLTVTSTTKGFKSLQRLERSSSILDLKCKFEMVTGIPAGSQKLQVFDSGDKFVCVLDDNDAKLGKFDVSDNYRIHVTSTEPAGVASTYGGIIDFNDTSKVEKYELDEESYDNMKGTVRDFKRKMKMGRFNEEDMAKQEAEKLEKLQKQSELQEEKLKNLSVNSRCKVSVPKTPSRLGSVRFLGKTQFSEGLWAGIEYDEPVGKNDGSVKGKRYFECKDRYGGFVKVEYVQCGHFPVEEDDFSDLDDEI